MYQSSELPSCIRIYPVREHRVKTVRTIPDGSKSSDLLSDIAINGRQ